MISIFIVGILAISFHLLLLRPLFFNRTKSKIMIPLETVGDDIVYKHNNIPYPCHFATTSNALFPLNDGYCFTIDNETTQGICIPHCFNTFYAKYRFYEGTFRYSKSFHFNKKKQKLYRLEVERLSMHSKVYLNGTLIATNDDPYQSFYADVTDSLRNGENDLLFICDNIMDDKSMLIKQFEGHKPGWNVYAGLTGTVSIQEMNPVYLFGVKIICEGNSLKGQCTYWGHAQCVEVSILRDNTIIARKNVQAQHAKEYSFVDIHFNDLPFEKSSQSALPVYTLKIRHCDEENTVHFSNKTVTVHSGKIVVNGENFHVKGINVHQEDIHKGIVLDNTDIEKLYSHIQKLNCNFVRLVHYPHSEQVYDYLDKNGILSMTEIPNYQAGLGMIQQVFSKSASIKENKKNIITVLKSIQTTKQLYDKTYLKNCQDSMTRLVIKKRNRPCAAVWNVGNECYTFTNSNRNALASLKEIVNRIDGTRPITYSVFTIPKLTIKYEKSFDLFDIISINEYYGWYYGTMAQATDYYQKISKKHNKPIIITETGSDSNIHHANVDLQSRDVNSQEYQSKMLLSHLDIKNDVDTFSGVCVWQLKDSFCTEYGEGDLVPYFNAKGLLSSDYHEKSAYNIVKQWNETNKSVDSIS